jgi:DNA polymerase II small subunit/DNA polymerase delta subunit B
MAPAVGKMGDLIARAIEQRSPQAQQAAQAAITQRTNDTIKNALSEIGQDINDLPQSVVQSLRAADVFLAQLAAAVDVDLMPGPGDPSNASLPQLPLL